MSLATRLILSSVAGQVPPPGPPPPPVGTWTVTTPYNADPSFSYFVRTDDIMVHWGNASNKTIPATNLGAYQAVIKNNGVTQATYQIPLHDRFATWYYEINPDTIVRTPAQIVSQGLMFPFGNPGTKVPPKPQNVFTGPMSTAGMTTAMGSTGERFDIGILPEWEAYAMRTGDFGPALAAAKGFRSMPIFIIDERTGRFWDLIARPYTTFYYNQSGITDFILSAPQGQWDMDLGHLPAVYVAYLATQKLRYLESIQAAANWGYMVTNWYVSVKGYAVVSQSQGRSCAWHLRNVLYAYKATLDAEAAFGSLPVPLQPSTYWKALLDNSLDYFTTEVLNNSGNGVVFQKFQYFPDPTVYRPWQFDHMLMSLALAAWWIPAWRPLYQWALNNPVQRLNNTSGWPPAFQVPYFLRLGPPGTMPDSVNNFPGDTQPAQYYSSWSAVWQGLLAEAAAVAPANYENMTQAQLAALQADPLGGGNFINWDSYTPQTLRQLMAMADYLDGQGLVPVKATYNQFSTCFSRITSMVNNWEVAASGNVIASRVSVIG